MKLYHAQGAYVSADLYPTQYGEDYCSSQYHFGPAIRNFYLIHYVYSGCGTLKTENKSYKIHAGQFFIIYPHENAYYEADKDDPWHYGWLEFDGTAAKRLAEEAGFSHENHVLDDNASVGETLKVLVDCGWCRYSKLMSHVWNFFAQTAENNLANKDDTGAKLYIADAESYIMSRIHGSVNVSEMAQFLNIDRSHLSRIFKQEKGLSPKQYIMSVKMDIAAQTLKKSDSTVKDTAVSVGYASQQEFSKAFKRRFGLSPSEWKKQNTYEQSIKEYV